MPGLARVMAGDHVTTHPPGLRACTWVDSSLHFVPRFGQLYIRVHGKYPVCTLHVSTGIPLGMEGR